MARPRVFVSSTYYDLKHLRSSLDNFIESLGFDSVLSEKGDIAFSPDVALDKSCFREIASADVFVLLIGGRYGSEVSSSDEKPPREFFDRYESITKHEYDTATARDIPVYILVESSVYSEYQTFLRNKGNMRIQYAHVDSVNVFHLIEDILSKPRNNPVHTFERYSDIQDWLREQWAGLFRELLQRISSQLNIASLSDQVQTLSETNRTMRRYLEAIMTKSSPDETQQLINTEKARLKELRELRELKTNKWVDFVIERFDVDVQAVRDALLTCGSFKEFAHLIADISGHEEDEDNLYPILSIPNAQETFNQARDILGLPAVAHHT